MRSKNDIVYVMRRNLIEPTIFVLSVDAKGEPNGMTAGWNMKCSYDPPMLAVALHDVNNTHKLILESKEFVVAVPSPELRGQLEYFGSVSGANVDKFTESKIATLPGTMGRTPLLADARINFECKLHSYAKPADHYVFFGTIVAARLNEAKEQLFYKGRNSAGERTFGTAKGMSE